MISLSTNTVSKIAPARTAIGLLTLLDSSGTSQTANWSLTPSAADYFLTSGSVLFTARGAIPAGLYAIHVRANAQAIPLREKTWFVIQVS